MAPMTVRPSTVVPAAIIPATVVAVVGSVAPIRSIITVTVAGIWRTVVVRAGSVIPGSVENRNRNGQTKDKVNTSAGRWLSDERQSRDNRKEDNELLHNSVLDEDTPDSIKRNESRTLESALLTAIEETLR